MNRLPQCFRCGRVGHVQLSCPNPANPEAKRLCNQLSRAQRTSDQHRDYLDRYNLRREAHQNYNGTVASLQPMINREIDYILGVKDQMEDIPSTDVGRILGSSLQVRALKDDMHSKLTGIRELIYTCKNTHDMGDPDFEEKHHVKIFRRQTADLEDLRNVVWRNLWKMDRHMDFGVKLLGDIREMKGKLLEIRQKFLDRKTLLANGVTLDFYDGMRTLERDALAALDKLYLFCPDQQVRKEQKFLTDIIKAITGIGSAVIQLIADDDFDDDDLDPFFSALEALASPTGSPF